MCVLPCFCRFLAEQSPRVADEVWNVVRPFDIFIPCHRQLLPPLFVEHQGLYGIDEEINLVESVSKHRSGVNPELLGQPHLSQL